MMRTLRFVLTTLSFILSLLAAQTQTAHAQMRITEFMYSGTGGEFVEFTNIGTTAIDMTGSSCRADPKTPGDVLLDAFHTVQPGESVILTQDDPTVFRPAWGLCANVKVI